MLKLANKWYERKVLSDDITLIFEPYVNPFSTLQHIWHIRGRDRDLLIDTGLGVSFLKEEIGDLIDKPLSAVATHIHYDPVGCLHEFDERIMHRIEAPRMPHCSEFCWLRISDFPEELHHAMRSDDYPEYLLTAQPDVAFNIDEYRIQSCTPTLEVEDGDITGSCLCQWSMAVMNPALGERE